MKTLTIKGFQNDKQIASFLQWYSCSGEQSFGTWLEVDDSSDMQFLGFSQPLKTGDVSEVLAEITGFE